MRDPVEREAVLDLLERYADYIPMGARAALARAVRALPGTERTVGDGGNDTSSGASRHLPLKRKARGRDAELEEAGFEV